MLLVVFILLIFVSSPFQVGFDLRRKVSFAFVFLQFFLLNAMENFEMKIDPAFATQSQLITWRHEMRFACLKMTHIRKTT